MRFVITRNRNLFGLGLLAAGLAVLLWLTWDTPLIFGPLRLDGLSLFFLLAMLVEPLVGALAGKPPAQLRRAAMLMLAAAVAVSTRFTVVIAVTFVLLSVLESLFSPVSASGPMSIRAIFGALARRTPVIIAALCLLIGYGTLAARGALAYDTRAAGAALDSLVFWFVLLAAAVPLVPVARSGNDGLWLLWLYPLVRLYSLGPWNIGWSLATVLLGGALAVWIGLRGFGTPAAGVRTAWYGRSYAGLALASFGLATSAGIGAGCYAVLVAAALTGAANNNQQGEFRAVQGGRFERGILVLVAPFVAAWMVVGAAVAGGVVALAAAAWLVALLGALAWVLRDTTAERTSRVFGVVSLVLGVGVPLVVGWLIEPAILQLQGGLTPYGDVVIWPWVGLAVVNSAQTQVLALPSIAVALLMLVLVALVYLLDRLRSSYLTDHALSGETAPDPRWLLDILHEEVPWLGSRSRSRGNGERQVDAD